MANKKKARVLRSKVLFRGPLFRVTSETVIEPGGIPARRDVVRHPGSVVVLAVADSAHGPSVLLERQYRHAAQDFLWELPAGLLDIDGLVTRRYTLADINRAYEDLDTDAVGRGVIVF